MTQTNNRLFDEFAKLATDAAGVAQGMRREVETAIRAQAERFLADMDVVSREEHELVKDVAARARLENDVLRDQVASLDGRVTALEEKLGIAPPVADVAVPGPDADA